MCVFLFDVYLRFACILLKMEKKKILLDSKIKRNGKGRRRRRGKRRKRRRAKEGGRREEGPIRDGWREGVRE